MNNAGCIELSAQPFKKAVAAVQSITHPRRCRQRCRKALNRANTRESFFPYFAFSGDFRYFSGFCSNLLLHSSLQKKYFFPFTVAVTASFLRTCIPHTGSSVLENMTTPP